MEVKKYTTSEIPFSDSFNKTEKYFNVTSRKLARRRVRACKQIQDLRKNRETPEGNADLLDLYLAIIRVHVETGKEFAEWAMKFNSNFENPLDKEDVLKAAEFIYCFRDENNKPSRIEINSARAIELLNLTPEEQEQLDTFRSHAVVAHLGYLKRKDPLPTKKYEPQADMKIFEIDPETMPKQEEDYMEKHHICKPKKKRPAESYNYCKKKVFAFGSRWIARPGQSKRNGMRAAASNVRKY